MSQNRIPLLVSELRYATMQHLLCGALFSTWVVLSQVVRCHFVLIGSDNVFFLNPPLFLSLLFYGELQTNV